MRDRATTVGRGTHATTDTAARHVSASFLGDVAARQLARDIDPDRLFLLVDLASDGVRITTVDPMTATTVGEQTSSTIRPPELDRLLAAHLVGIGRVASPTTEASATQLVELAARARARLSTAENTFMVGRGHVRFFRVGRSDLADATAIRATEMARLCLEAANEAPSQVSSVVLAPGHDAWPGLPAMLGQRLAAPVVTVEPPGARGADRAHANRIGRRTMAPTSGRRSDDVPAGPHGSDPGRADPSAVSPSLPAPSRESEGAPGSFGSPDAETDSADDAITAPIPRVGLLLDWPDDDPIPADGPLPIPIAALSTDQSPGWGQHDAAPRLLVGIVVMCAIIGIVTAASIALIGPREDSDAPPALADGTSSASAVAPTYADPADLAVARLPAVRYVPPPPPPESASTSDSGSGSGSTGSPPARQRPQSRQPAPAPAPALPPVPAPPALPPPRVIPNPIPGLPPIVLPF